MRKVRQKDVPYFVDRSCLSKANLTEEEANRVIDYRLKFDGFILYYYKCQMCGSHHLTSQQPVQKDYLDII